MIDEKTKTQVSHYLPADETVAALADFFSLFSDHSRVKLLSLLSLSKMCVGDICNILKMNQTTVSHQLRILRDLRIVKTQRCGKTIYYSIATGKINEVLLLGVEYLGF